MNNQARKLFRENYFRKFKNSKAPVEGIFELTGRCNFNCKMCYVHTKSNTEFLKTEHDGDWWISQIDAACERGMLFALLTGGECLLHPDFKRIYNHLCDKGVYTRINTNGFLLTQEMVDYFKERPPFEIQITIYGADDETYEQVTGVHAFQRVVDAIKRVQEADLPMKVSVTPNSYAPGATEKIVALLKQLQVPYNINPSMFTPYEENAQQKLSNAEVDTEEKIRYLRLQKDREITAIPESELPPIGGKQDEPVFGMTCSAGRVSFVIAHDGFMQPCTATYHLRVPVATAADFGSAWEQMLNASANYQMPIECVGCAYKKACLSCPVARGGKVGNGHCDPDVCKMTRQLVAAGVKKLEQPQEE